MASTVTVQSTVNWARGYLGFAPLSGGVSGEPALTAANMILQTILAPPFAWRWNRASILPFTTASGVSSYLSSGLAAFGYLEKATVTQNSQTVELESRLLLAASSEEGRPVYISPALDDGGGGITFRLLPVPDGVYTVNADFQKFAPSIQVLSNSWSPIPDAFRYIYSWGFLSLMYEYWNNPRAMPARQIFVASLLGASEGLTSEEKDLFSATWLGQQRASLGVQLSEQLAQRARAT